MTNKYEESPREQAGCGVPTSYQKADDLTSYSHTICCAFSQLIQKDVAFSMAAEDVAVDELVCEIMHNATSSSEIGTSYHPIEIRKSKTLSYDCLNFVECFAEPLLVSELGCCETVY